MSTRYLPNIPSPAHFEAVIDVVEGFSPVDYTQWRWEQTKLIGQLSATGQHRVVLVDYDLSNFEAFCRMRKIPQTADAFRKYLDWRGPQQEDENVRPTRAGVSG
jgi:hypothetical protein